MKKIKLKYQAKNKNYDIYIGKNIIEKINSIYSLKNYSKIFIVTDENAEKLFLKKIISVMPSRASYISLPSGEKEKNISNIEKIWKALYLHKCDRKSLVINLGGGVISDLGGFAASTYMRGIDFLNIPTTLLSQVDAGIGGKTGFDFLEIKNLVGSFQQPIGVIIDINTLKTLPKQHFISGFAEIIKHGLIRDRNYFEKVTQKKPLDFTEDEMIDIITTSCKIKKDIVEKDEKESGIRKILNFGHTIGHAVEALSIKTKHPLLHGEAISVGISYEARISQLLKMISTPELRIIKDSLANAGLPTELDMKIKDILIKIKADKKNEKEEIKFSLLKGIGNAVYDQDVTQEMLVKTINCP